MMNLISILGVHVVNDNGSCTGFNTLGEALEYISGVKR